MWLVQSDTKNKWDVAQYWQEYMIKEAIKGKKDYYASHIHNLTRYTYVCTQQSPGNIILWNLTTHKLRIVIHSEYGTPCHNGASSGGGMCIDHMYIANSLQLIDI